MHILVIPSEFFEHKEIPLAGIFQKDSIKVLVKNNCQVGVLAIKPEYTTYDLIYSTVKTRIGTLNKLSLFKSWFQFVLSLLIPIKYRLRMYASTDCFVVKYKGPYSLNTKNDKNKEKDWIKIGDKAYKKYVAKFGKPDVIHAHNIKFAGILGNALSKKYETPIVLTEHSSSHYFNKLSQSQINDLREEFQTIDIVSSVSPSLSILLKEKYSLDKEIDSLPNLIDLDFGKKLSIPKRESHEFRFIQVASLIPLKNQELLIRAFYKAFANEKNIKLTIVGSGSEYENLTQLVQDLLLTNQVYLKGELGREQVAEEMANSNVLVHSSNYETFGVVLIEAMSLGKPVVSTACGGPNFIVNKENGILVPVNNEKELANAMTNIYNSYDKYDSKYIMQEVRAKFSEASYWKKLEALYKRAISKNKKFLSNSI